MKNKIISITILFLLMATVGFAQNHSSWSRYPLKIGIKGKKNSWFNDPNEKGFTIHSVNFTAGYYSPEMDYWNNTYLPSKDITETFGGNLAVGANITFFLPANFRTRVGASIWSGEVKGTSGSSVDGLKIGFTRFSLGFFYAPENISLNGFQPYLGVEVQENLIKNTYNINGSSIIQQGNDISFAPVFGLDRSFGHFICGLEVKYNLGNYTQEEDNEVILEHKVSVTGAEVSLSIGYKF
ncbi:MAG TPA: hypothetical protein VFC65_03335 [Prolixibacteraceae bacterium]|nr:hypothetical protein [Prolixibacteraceae bacterium]